MIAPHHQAEYDAFVRSILDRPDDALPRMMLSDWCEQNGYDAEAACLRQKKPRLPIDEWTVRACATLTKHVATGQFVQDVCVGVRVFGTEQETIVIDGIPITPGDRIAVINQAAVTGERSRIFRLLADHKDRLSPRQLATVWGIVLQRRRRCGPELVQRARIVLPERLARLNDPTSACTKCGGTGEVDCRFFDGKRVGPLTKRRCLWCDGTGGHSPLPRTIGVES